MAVARMTLSLNKPKLDNLADEIWKSAERLRGKFKAYEYVFGTATGQYQGTIRTAWESLMLLAHGLEPTRTRAHGRVNREHLAEIDLHWHDLRHEAACRWLAKGPHVRARLPVHPSLRGRERTHGAAPVAPAAVS